MNPLDLIRLQITLEYQLDALGRLVPFPGSSEQGLYIVYRYAGGCTAFFDHRLPESLCEQLRGLGCEQTFEAPGNVQRVVQAYTPCRFEGRFVSEYLPRLPEAAEFPLVSQQQGQFVVRVDGEPVCRAWSERGNDACAEVAVETHPDHRRQGYARQAVAAWASDVIGSGRVALYSYKAGNESSRALAHSLGAVWYADVVCYSP